jgi:hypothetical protein
MPVRSWRILPRIRYVETLLRLWLSRPFSRFHSPRKYFFIVNTLLSLFFMVLLERGVRCFFDLFIETASSYQCSGQCFFEPLVNHPL